MKANEKSKECGCPESVKSDSMYADDGAIWFCEGCGRVEEAVGSHARLFTSEQKPLWPILLFLGAFFFVSSLFDVPLFV